MKHVLITGAAGFIGSHLCDSLLARGYAVTGVDNFLTGREENLNLARRSSFFQFIKADVSELLEEERFSFLKKYGLQGVLHFACPASPVDFDKLPFEILAVDSFGTMHTVELALKYGARFILASTSEVYGDPLEHPQKEEYWGNVNTIGPRACYDETKRFAEAFVSTAMRGKGQWKGKPVGSLNAGIVRIFNTYGPRMRPDDGRVVPEFCLQALENRDLTIHGNGQQTRSFCYVDDLVDGIIRLFESQVQVPVNIGNPTEWTIREFAEAILALCPNSKSKIKSLEPRLDDPKRRQPDISRARSMLGWEPRVDLRTGLAKSLEYFRPYANRTRS